MHHFAVRTLGLAAVFAVSSSAIVQAQLTFSQSTGCPAARGIARPDSVAARAVNPTGKPDILLLVGFSADQLTFNSPPNASIRLCWGSDSLHIVERRNLPSPLVAGTTYRNVYIAAELRAYLNPECLTRALGVATSAVTDSVTAGCAALGITNLGASTSKPPPPGATTVSGRRQ